MEKKENVYFLFLQFFGKRKTLEKILIVAVLNISTLPLSIRVSSEVDILNKKYQYNVIK